MQCVRGHWLSTEPASSVAALSVPCIACQLTSIIILSSNLCLDSCVGVIVMLLVLGDKLACTFGFHGYLTLQTCEVNSAVQQ